MSPSERLVLFLTLDWFVEHTNVGGLEVAILRALLIAQAGLAMLEAYVEYRRKR